MSRHPLPPAFALASRALASRALAALLLLPVAACDEAPLRWEPAAPAPIDAAPNGVLLLPFAIEPAGLPPAPGGLGAPCEQTVRVVPLDTGSAVAVWWAVRPDSSATLLAARGARRRDASGALGAVGAAWEPPIAIDTLDRGAHGCARPAPAVTFEPRTRYVHVSYAMDAPEGTGVFFAHSMDAGRMWHSPVSIVYGPRLAATAIAARGDTVAIAYEDPNGDVPQVALALSVTAGHIFEEKSIPVSSGTHAASAPAVSIDSAVLWVGWQEREGAAAVQMHRRGTWAR